MQMFRKRGFKIFQRALETINILFFIADSLVPWFQTFSILLFTDEIFSTVQQSNNET